jgi:hypothetical protein
MAELAEQVPEHDRLPSGCRSDMPISAMRAAIVVRVTSHRQPATSPFTSAMNTGTPMREKPSAIVISVTVLPVPVAPATRPCRLPYLAAGTRCRWVRRGDGLADEDGVHARVLHGNEGRF